MLNAVPNTQIPLSAPTRVAIVASTYNSRFVDALVVGAQAVFAKHPLVECRIVRVPGAFEIPAVAARCASENAHPLDAIICFGVVLQGATSHANVIVDAVSKGLVDLQIRTHKPIVHGVYHFETESIAMERCLGPDTNRGRECGRVALEMAEIMRQVP